MPDLTKLKRTHSIVRVVERAIDRDDRFKDRLIVLKPIPGWFSPWAANALHGFWVERMYKRALIGLLSGILLERAEMLQSEETADERMTR